MNRDNIKFVVWLKLFEIFMTKNVNTLISGQKMDKSKQNEVFIAQLQGNSVPNHILSLS